MTAIGITTPAALPSLTGIGGRRSGAARRVSAVPASAVVASSGAASPTAAQAAPSSRTRLRMTSRGRRVLLALATVPVAAGIALGTLSGGTAAAAPETAAAGSSFSTLTVMPGDTLWSIAAELAPGADPREVIGEITRLNQLRSSGLLIGQQLAIPAAYAR